MSPVALEQYREQILALILQKLVPNNCIVFVFGSYALGNAHGNSDIDIGLLCIAPIPAGTFVELQEQLDNRLPWLRKIDLVDFAALTPTVRDQALQRITLWHVGKNCRALADSLTPPIIA